jgi:hypothetical protein
VNAQLVNNGDGTYTFTKTESGRFSATIPIYIPANKSFCMSANIIENTSATKEGIQLRFTNSEGEVGYGAVIKLGSSAAFTKPVTAVQLYMQHTDADGAYIKFRDFQIEIKGSKTDYEPYIEGEAIAAAVGEIVELSPIAPNMTIYTATNGALLDVAYKRDINKAFEKIEQAIISLGGNL